MPDSKDDHEALKRDRVIADSGWGVKPDDQPANVDEAKVISDRRFVYDASIPDVIKTILRLQRQSCNTANRVILEPGRTIIYDLNGDSFVIEGLSYGNEHLFELLRDINAAFDPRQLRKVKADDPHTREYDCSRAWAWGAERTG